MGMLLNKEYYLGLERENADLRTAVDCMDDIIAEQKAEIAQKNAAINRLTVTVNNLVDVYRSLSHTKPRLEIEARRSVLFLYTLSLPYFTTPFKISSAFWSWGSRPAALSSGVKGTT